jgi:hypothetical protein
MSDPYTGQTPTVPPPSAARYFDAPIGAARQSASGVRWMLMLVVFMRLAAVLWLSRG